MKGVAIEKVGAPAVVVDNLEMPEPAENQVLVKSIYTAMNPADSFMSSTGLLVVEWPFILGCDAAGIVVKVGAKASTPLGPLKVGDEVCGCTRLGCKGHSTCQEYFLMDAALTIPKPKNVSLAQAATIGVGAYTASLAIFNGFSIPIPSPSNLPAPKDEWALVTGGASSVGKYAVQILHALGFKVVSTCSAASASVVHACGAEATIDYKHTEEEQMAELLALTSGKVGRIFDATAGCHGFAAAVFGAFPSEGNGGEKMFATTCDWIPMASADFHDAQIYQIRLGPIGRAGAEELNKDIEAYIPLLVGLFESGAMVPSEYEVVGVGFEAVNGAWEYQMGGKGGSKKVLVKLQEE